MAIMNQLRSPISWVGGKHYSANHIIKQFPEPRSYDVYVEPFGGAASVLLHKQPYHHVEVYNDVNSDLVNFWIHCRDHAQVLEERCSTLPYARSLYYQYHRSLYDGTEMDSLERAVRWFYVLRSSFSGQERVSPTGWKGGIKTVGQPDSRSYRSAIQLFERIQQRCREVLIDNRDFADVLQSYNRPRTLIYCDPPYIDAEDYYVASKDAIAMHTHLAELLNASSASIALSYYPHTLVDQLYPASKWRRITWNTTKHSDRSAQTRSQATEMLLMNYEPASKQVDLWSAAAILPSAEQDESEEKGA